MTHRPSSKTDLLTQLRTSDHVHRYKGRHFVSCIGLNELAKENGLESFTTRIVNLGSQIEQCVVIAIATGSRGTWIERGEASPMNVPKNLAHDYVKVARTRARTRCLSAYLGIKIVRKATVLCPRGTSAKPHQQQA